VLLFPDGRSSSNEISTDDDVTDANDTACAVLEQGVGNPLLGQAELKTTNSQRGFEQETEPIIPSSLSTVSIFKQAPSTRKFDADWKASLQVNPPSFPNPLLL